MCLGSFRYTKFEEIFNKAFTRVNITQKSKPYVLLELYR